MAKVAYIERNFRGEALTTIVRANQIAQAYAAQGFDLTLRQLYYQFVSRGFIPNKDSEYKKLGSVINDARLAGYIDWDAIVDRTRNLRDLSHWTSPSEIINAVSRQYREDKWAEQPEYVEVWIEKDALVGVLDSVCPANDVPYFSCRGYTSQSEIWGAAQRLGGKIEEGKKVTVIHLGDHDPSGIDMSRDIEDRLAMFIAQDLGRIDHGDGGYFERDGGGYDSLVFDCKEELYDELTIDRIALNWDQVQAYNPPPNPAKITDSRATKYIARFGQTSWELDALDPATLVALIQNAIDEHKDFDLWGESQSREERRKDVLRQASRRWAEVEAFLEGVA